MWKVELKKNKNKKTPFTLDFCLVTLAPHPLPVFRWQISDLVLRDEILQDLGDVLEVRLVVLKFDPVDQRCQLIDLLSWTFVVASQILWQLLLGQMSGGIIWRSTDSLWFSTQTRRVAPDPSSARISGTIRGEQEQRRSRPNCTEQDTTPEEGGGVSISIMLQCGR